MPGLYAPGDYDLAGFAVGAAERGALLPRDDLAPGDIVIGLASSGVHSNGYSLVRRIVGDRGLEWSFPFPPDGARTLADIFLAPTRLYVKPALAAIRDTGAVKALAHITGGGLTENIPRVLPESLAAEIDLGAIETPAVFRWLAEAGGIARDEMLRTFNCGVGMILIAADADAGRVEASLREAGETPMRIGRLTEKGGAAVVYVGRAGFEA
jgi:phosphoribosylformylglycinamidine cyclo-ligase